MSIYIYKNQYLSPTRMSSYITMKVALYIIYSLGTPVSSTNKTDRHDVTEILMKVALNTNNHQYHIICMQNIYDNQFHCNIIFLIKICLDNFFNFTFQRSSISYTYCPHLRYRFVNRRAIVFLVACPRYQTCFMGWRIWISTSWGHNSFIIFIHSSNTYPIWNKPFVFAKIPMP